MNKINLNREFTYDFWLHEVLEFSSIQGLIFNFIFSFLFFELGTILKLLYIMYVN